MDVIVTVDTEADNQWEYSELVTTRNLDELPRFQALCDRHGIRPTYLCTYEVIEAPALEALLAPWQERGAAEIGAHLHPWTNPPFSPAAKGALDPEAYPAFPCELSDEVFRAKLGALTARIRDRTGRAPRSYRAGRWGFVAAHVPALLALGYSVDCSVTPLVSWAHIDGIRGGGPDFREAPLAPYFLSPDDACRPGSSTLLEVPVTIVHPRAALRRSAALRRAFSRHRKTFVAKALNRLFGLDPVWLRPYPQHSAARLLDVCRVARDAGLPAVEMMFHSSELMAGGSPYNPTPASIERLYERLDALFGALARQGCRGVTLGDFAAGYRRDHAAAAAAGG